MKTTPAALACFALLALAAPAPWSAALPARADDCSPVPQVVALECGDVPWAGAVALSHHAGSVTVAATPDLACAAPVVTATTATTTCTPVAPGVTLCLDPHAFAMADLLGGAVTATADCGAAPATCTTGPAPGTFCFSAPTVGNVGVFPLTCKADVGAASITGFTWWVQCSQPV